jgi:hypothetical protein
MGDPEHFLAERRLLFAIAYRMLGSAADAEDVLQDAFSADEHARGRHRRLDRRRRQGPCRPQPDLQHPQGRPVPDRHCQRCPGQRPISLTRLNGQPGAVITESGRVTTAIVLDILRQQVTGVRIIVNPDKLSRLQASLS